jgi:hypothetical protein
MGERLHPSREQPWVGCCHHSRRVLTAPFVDQERAGGRLHP